MEPMYNDLQAPGFRSDMEQIRAIVEKCGCTLRICQVIGKVEQWEYELILNNGVIIKNTRSVLSYLVDEISYHLRLLTERDNDTV